MPIFVQPGIYNTQGAFEPRQFRAQDVTASNGTSAEEHITDAVKHLTPEQTGEISGAVQSDAIGAANGVASLDANAKITPSQLDGAALKTAIGLASAEDNGVMPKETFSQVTKNTADIASLQSAGLWRGTFATKAALPTGIPNSAFVGGTVTLNDFVEVTADETQGGASTRYAATGITSGTIAWTFKGIIEAPIPLANEETPGLFKGTEDEAANSGKIFVESDGTGSVIGWEAQAGRIAALEGAPGYTPADASTSQKGVVQLSSATNSTSESLAATPKAVKDAYDLAGTANTAAGSAASEALKLDCLYAANEGVITANAAKLRTNALILLEADNDAPTE
jgi:hypothetical protein